MLLVSMYRGLKSQMHIPEVHKGNWHDACEGSAVLLVHLADGRKNGEHSSLDTFGDDRCPTVFRARDCERSRQHQGWCLL